MQIYGTKEGAYIGKGINSHRIGWSTNMAALTSCEYALFKYARAVKQKVWNKSETESETGEIKDAKNTFFFLSPHTPYRRVRLAGFARVRFLLHVYRFLY